MRRPPVVLACAVVLCLSRSAAAQPRTVRLTEPVIDFDSTAPDIPSSVSISADGITAMFTSNRANLALGDANDTATTFGTDVFIRHLPMGVTRRILGVGGAEPNGDAGVATLTSDGRYVFFTSQASNLVPNDPNGASPSVFRHEVATNTTLLLDIGYVLVSPSGDGRYIAYRDFSGWRLRDLQAGTTSDFLVGGLASDLVLSGNGSIAAFLSSHIPGVYTGTANQALLYDRDGGRYELVSRRPDGQPGNGGSYPGVALSGNGRYVAFVSEASDLVAGDTNGVADAFVHDRSTGQTTRVSLQPGGGQRTGASLRVAISGDGSTVAFVSAAAPDCAGCSPRYELAVYDRALANVQIASVGWDGSPANDSVDGYYSVVSLDGSGRQITFTTAAGNLVLGDRNGGVDVFLRDRGLAPACSYQVAQPVIDVGASGGAVSVGITTGGGCAWEFTPADSWVTSSANTGNGPAAVSVTIAPNTGVARFGYAALGGQRILIRQPGPLGTTAPQFELAGIGPTGQAFPNGTYVRGISADGRYVPFLGKVGALASGFAITRVYLRDRLAGTTIDVSHAPGGPAEDPNVAHDMPGVPSPDGTLSTLSGSSVSRDGRFAYFTTRSLSGPTGECYVFDRQAGTSSRIPSDAVIGSFCPSMSVDGRYFTGFDLGTPGIGTQTVKLYDQSTRQTSAFTFPGLPARDVVVGAYSSATARYVVVRVKEYTLSCTQCAEYAVLLDRTTGTTARTQTRGWSSPQAAALMMRMIEPVWAEFGLPRFAIRLPLSTTECELVDRQTRQVTALPELLALAGGPGYCSGLAVNGGQQIVFQTARYVAPGDINSNVHIYARATGNVSRLTANPGGNTYPVGLLTATPDGRYLLAQAVTGASYYSGVGNVVVFDLGLADAVDSSAPTNLEATVTGTTVRLTWSAPAQGAPAAYVIQAGSTTGASNLASFDTGSSVTALTTSAPVGTYYVRVRARSGATVGGPSNEVVVSVTGGCPLPSSPAGLSRTVNSTSVQLSWQAAAGATSYLLEAGSSPSMSNLLASNVGDVTALGATAAPGTYYVRVRAVNACGSSAPSNEVVVVVGGCAPTSAPATPGATVTNGVVSMSWGAVAGATGYVVYAGTSTGASNAGVFQVGGTSISGAAPRGRYYVRVHARNGCGLGPPSSEVVIDVP